MEWNREEIVRLRRLYQDGVPIQKIASILKRSTGAIEGKLRNSVIKRNRSGPKLTLPSKITPALARIHAHICGDGNLFEYREKDSYGYLGCYKPNSYRYRYGILYTNLNRKLICEFMEDAKYVFKIRPCHYSSYVKVKSKDIWILLKELGAGKSRDWFISEKIMNADGNIKKNWIRAFFDDEAYFNDHGRIRVRSVNRKGLTQVMLMLKTFIPCHITPKEGYYPDGSVYLNINKYNANNYFLQIGSSRYTYK